jgi:large subunit ribosomal protein L19e
MSIKFTRRIAAQVMGRGENAVKIKKDSVEDAKKAITRDDVRALIGKGAVYTIKEKRNMSRYGSELKKKRSEGRSRGPGRKKGTYKARTGILYKKKVRAQRRIISMLKEQKLIDNEMYKKFYALVKGGTFMTKVQLINHIKGNGVKMDDALFDKLRHA